MQKFDWQLHLRTIDEELEEMFQLINKDLSHLGDVELTYAVSDVWDMVQKSNVVGNGQTSLAVSYTHLYGAGADAACYGSGEFQ